jgi:hypothetical protein
MLLPYSKLWTRLERLASIKHIIVGAMTLCIMAFSIMTLSIKAYLRHWAYVILEKNDTQNSNTVIMLSVVLYLLLF